GGAGLRRGPLPAAGADAERLPDRPAAARAGAGPAREEARAAAEALAGTGHAGRGGFPGAAGAGAGPAGAGAVAGGGAAGARAEPAVPGQPHPFAMLGAGGRGVPPGRPAGPLADAANERRRRGTVSAGRPLAGDAPRAAAAEPLAGLVRAAPAAQGAIVMRFWVRELAGWLLVLLGLYVFYVCFAVLVWAEGPWFIEAIFLTVIR